MMANLGTVWSLTPHTRAKHDLLSRYLGGWFPILSRYNGRVVFLDGFAGPGVYSRGEPGSPVVALETLLTHSYWPNMRGREFVFLFNEADRDRFTRLQQVVNYLQAKYQPWPANVKLQLGNSTFEDTANEMLAYLDQQRVQLAPTFAFVDPFGVSGMPMNLLSRLLSFDRCELFVYFNFDTVNRFATAGNIDKRLNELFGTDIYQQVRDLAGPVRKKYLHDLYQHQLTTVCGFPFVKSFEMINEMGHTGYYLFFGTRNITGLKVMKEAMWKVDPGGGQLFSARIHRSITCDWSGMRTRVPPGLG
jgi:three-Cys-motif partner protein